MILHLGAGHTVPLRDIVAVLRLEGAETCDIQRFLSTAEAMDEVVSVPEGVPKSMVVAVDAHMRRRVFLSPISARTLQVRCVLPIDETYE